MHKATSVIVISPELNELETFRIEQRAKMKGTSPRMEYLNYKCTPEYRRQRLLDGVRLAEEADAERGKLEEESRKAAVKSWVALGLSVAAAAASVLSFLAR